MKKLGYVLVAVLLFDLVLASPINVEAATLQDYIDKVNQYAAEVNEAQSKINQTEAEITATKNQINKITEDVKQMAIDIENMHKEIEKYNEEIKTKSLQTKELFQYLQIASGENVYLEYAFGAKDITDMIYRMSIVEQLTEYNDNTIKELEELIEANKKREKELNQKQVELDQKKVELNQKISSLEGEKISISEGAVGSRQQLKMYQDTVNSYKKLGCQPSDVIGVDCAREASTNGWFRPTEQGYITGEMGPRDISIGGDNFHYGLDLSSNRKRSEKIYPIGTGTIKKIYTDMYGAKMLLIYYNDASTGKTYSSLYAHMSAYAPGLYEGKTVSPSDYVGYMGDTGFAYGVHLHIEVADCKLYDPTDRNCSTWSRYTSYVRSRYYAGFKGARSLISFPSRWQAR